MDDGSILGVKGETNTVVTSRDINCGGESTLSVVKGEVKPSIEPVVEEPLEMTEEKQQINTEVQLGFDNVGEQTTTIEETKPIKVDIYKSNNLEDGKLVGSWETGDLNISTENKEIVTDISSSAAEVPVDAGSASVIPNATNLDGAPKEELTANAVLTDNTSDSTDATSQSSSNTTLVEETSVEASGDVNAENVVLRKDFIVAEEAEKVSILLTENDTRIGEVISKPVEYWYEIELNPDTQPQTVIGHDGNGAKIFKLFPEGVENE
jgi:hypothetical protein